MANRIVAFILDVHMAFSHDGLHEIAKKEKKLDLDKLKVGEFVLFANRPFTAFKLFGAGNAFLYYRQEHPLNPRALMRMVSCFDGVKFDYKKALQETILKQLDPNLRRSIEKQRLAEAAAKKDPAEG